MPADVSRLADGPSQRRPGPPPCARRSDVAYLNDLAQTARLHAGEVSASSETYGDLTVYVGDSVMALRNDYRRGMLNGQRAVVTDGDEKGVTIHTSAGTTVEMPRRILERGHIQLGYAATIRKSQGATIDGSLVLAADDLGYEAGYTALSRGRAENRLYVTEAFTRPKEIRQLCRSASKHLAQDSAGLER